LRSTFLNDLKKEVRFSVGTKNFQDPPSASKKRPERSTFIQSEKEEERKAELVAENKHLRPVPDFVDENGFLLPSVRLPYSSIDVIF